MELQQPRQGCSCLIPPRCFLQREFFWEAMAGLTQCSRRMGQGGIRQRNSGMKPRVDSRLSSHELGLVLEQPELEIPWEWQDGWNGQQQLQEVQIPIPRGSCPRRWSRRATPPVRPGTASESQPPGAGNGHEEPGGVVGSPRIPSCRDGGSEASAPSTVPVLGWDIPGTSATPWGRVLLPLGWAGMGWDVSRRSLPKAQGQDPHRGAPGCWGWTELPRQARNQGRPSSPKPRDPRGHPLKAPSARASSNP